MPNTAKVLDDLFSNIIIAMNCKQYLGGPMQSAEK